VVEKTLRTTATEFTELQNDLDVNAKFYQKRFCSFTKSVS